MSSIDKLLTNEELENRFSNNLSLIDELNNILEIQFKKIDLSDIIKNNHASAKSVGIIIKILDYAKEDDENWALVLIEEETNNTIETLKKHNLTKEQSELVLKKRTEFILSIYNLPYIERVKLRKIVIGKEKLKSENRVIITKLGFIIDGIKDDMSTEQIKFNIISTLKAKRRTITPEFIERKQKYMAEYEMTETPDERRARQENERKLKRNIDAIRDSKINSEVVYNKIISEIQK